MVTDEPLRTPSPYRADIDGMRAIAVLGVVAFHANPRLAPGGFAGVDVFFVISGYLISSIILDGLQQGTFAASTFYTRRLARLAPALALVLAVTGALGWFLLLPSEYEDVGTHMAAGAGFVANLALWAQTGYFDSDAASKPLLHLWSLGVEEQFYLLWPALLVAGWRWRTNLLAIILLVGAASFILNVGTISAHPAAAFYLPTSRLWELMIGALLAYVTLAGSPSSRLPLPAWLPVPSLPAQTWRPAVLALAGVLLLAASLTLIRDVAFPGWWALAPTIGTAFLLAAGPQTWFNRVVLSHPALVLVGLISYPLYLWHWPLLTLARVVADGDPGPAVTTAVVAVAAVLAWATYRFVERPIRTAQHRRPHVWRTAALAAALIAVGSAGAYVRTHARTLPARFPANVQYLVDFGYDYQTAYRERRCYLMPDQGRDAFAPECVEPGEAPLVVLWGDSHAAHLYPGLQRLQRERRFRVAQFTGSRCPPLLAVDIDTQPFCRDINDSVIARIGQLQPATIVMAARWDVYDQTRLDDTIAAIRRVSPARIIVVGPVPNWAARVPRLLFNQIRRRLLRDDPHRLPFLDGNYDRAERQLRERAMHLGAAYASSYRILCNAQGCLARIGDNPGLITTWDDQHLTSDGSEFLVRGFADDLFAAANSHSVLE